MSAQRLAIAIQCPVCPVIVDVAITCTIVDGERAHEGHASLVCTPDTADLWAHMWTHDVAAPTKGTP